MTNDTQLARLRYVAGHYRELQGLALVPFGLIFLAPGLIPDGWGQQGETWRWFTIIGALLMSWLATIYYQRAVGRAWPALRTGGSYRWLAIMIGGALLFGYFAAPWYDGLVNPPISVTAFVMAGLLLIPFVALPGIAVRRSRPAAIDRIGYVRSVSQRPVAVWLALRLTLDRRRSRRPHLLDALSKAAARGGSRWQHLRSWLRSTA